MHGVEQAQLLTPLGEGERGLLQKQPLNGAFAGAAIFRERGKGSLFTGVGEEGFHDAAGTDIGGPRQLQGNGANLFELIDEQVGDAAMRWLSAVEAGETAGVQDELSEERGDIHHEASRRQGAA